MSATLRDLIARRHEATRERQLQAVEFLAHRKALGLTQAALAEALGMTPNHVALMERGERPVMGRTWLQLRLLRSKQPTTTTKEK